MRKFTIALLSVFLIASISAPAHSAQMTAKKFSSCADMLKKYPNGVAKNSYHMQGKAVDLRLQGVPLKTVRKAALDLRMGGVGYYSKSGFVHIDSGRVRSW